MRERWEPQLGPDNVPQARGAWEGRGLTDTDGTGCEGNGTKCIRDNRIIRGRWLLVSLTPEFAQQWE